MPLAQTPDRFFNDSGNPIPGIWRGYGPPVSPDMFHVWRDRKRPRLTTEKRWQFIGLTSPSHFLGLAVVHVGYIGQYWLYIYDRNSETLREWKAMTPLARGVTAELCPKTGEWAYTAGRQVVRISADAASGKRTVSIAIKGRAGRLSGSLELKDSGAGALCYLGEPAPQHFNLTYKTAGLPASGELKLDGKESIIFNEEETGGHVDWTWGCPPRHTFWNWSAASGFLEDGRRLGWNIGTGLNESPNFENVVWLDGEPSPLDGVRFDYDRIMGSWMLTESSERASLMFEPTGLRKENIQLGLISSQFEQPFGNYSGYFVLEDDQRITFDGIPGVSEEHTAKW